MINEDKAREIASKYFPVGSPHYTTEVAAQIDCQNAVNEMAEWKDQQFKECLEKKKEELGNAIMVFGHDIKKYAKIDLLNEIINELFPESEEQDNSDNDE